MDKRSDFLTLNARDVFRGSLIAFGSALLPTLLVLLQQDHWPTWVEFRPYLQAAISAAITYLLKNYFTNSKGQFARIDKKENNA